MLRTVIIFCLAVLLGFFSGCIRSPGDQGDKDRVQPNLKSSNEQIRSLLLSHTPIGTAATNVLAFAADGLNCDWVCASAEYINAFGTSKHHRVPMRPEPNQTSQPDPRFVSVQLGRYSAGFETYVLADWTFDANDKLTGINVERRSNGL